jgi:predicted nuclease with TOPRIM domain
MNELKPEDVMSALEYCATNMRCYECPYVVVKGGKCHSNMVSDVLALLKKYQAENAEKDAEIERLNTENGILKKRLDEAETNIELLEDAVGDVSDDEVEQLEKLLSMERAEAIDEFVAGCVEMAIGIYGVPVVWLESILKFAEKIKGESYGNEQGKTGKP